MKQISTNEAMEINGGKKYYYCKSHRKYFSSYGSAWWHTATKHVGDWATVWAKLVVAVFL